MPLSHTECIHALRAHALDLPAVAVASGTLAATATGFSRADGGSFLADGILPGMEVAPLGFTATAPALVYAVTATTLATAEERTAEPAAPGRSLSFGLPLLVAWEGDEFPPKVNGVETDITNRWWIDEDYVSGPSSRMTTGPNPWMEHQPGYFLNLYSPPGYGIGAPYALADALVEHFAAGTALVLPSGDVLRVRGDPAPFRSQLTTVGASSVITVTIPLRIRTANSI